MKIFLTGASGFIGAHTARCLLDAGHELRLLVRKPEPVQAYFQQFGYHIDDLVVADMRDAGAIERGLAGCDGVFHAAALVSLDPRRSRELYQNNAAGLDAVLGTACRLGMKRIVYVSSLSVLFQAGLRRINEATPLSQPQQAYARSKRDCDAHVRGMQEAGEPIQMSYPAAVVGPDDPKLSEGNNGLRAFFRGPIPLTSTGFQCIDVRDLALAHRYMLENPVSNPCDGRFVIGGHYQPWAEVRRLAEQVSGRKVTGLPLPGACLRFIGRCADLARRIVPFESQLSSEAMQYATQWVVADSQRIQDAAGIAFRSSMKTYQDTARWLLQSGYISAGNVPALANSLQPARDQ